MNKRVLFLICIAASVVLLITGVYANASISVSTAEADDEFTINVGILENTGFSYCKGSVSYDDTQLELISLEGKLLDDAVCNPATGLISFASAYNLEANGTLFTATFRAADSVSSGTSTVKIAVTMRSSDGAYLMDRESAETIVTISSVHGETIIYTEESHNTDIIITPGSDPKKAEIDNSKQFSAGSTEENQITDTGGNEVLPTESESEDANQQSEVQPYSTSVPTIAPKENKDIIQTESKKRLFLLGGAAFVFVCILVFVIITIKKKRKSNIT